MQRTKHSIARTGSCRASGDHLVPANEEAHQQNLDAAQRELDRRAAEGEDVGHLRVNPTTYVIEPADPAARADLERDHNKGPKLAARDDARALDLQTNGFNLQQQLKRDEADRIAGMNWPAIPDLPDPNTNLVAGWTGLSAADLELEP